MLTKEQKQSIVIHLCYPVTVLEKDHVNYHSIINDRLNYIDDVFVEGKVQAIIEKIDNIQSNYQSMAVKGNVRRIDDIEFDTSIGSLPVKKEERRLKKMLSSLLDIPSACSSGSAGVCW